MIGISTVLRMNRSLWLSKGSGRTYSITLCVVAYDEKLRLVCTFEMDPPREKLPVL